MYLQIQPKHVKVIKYTDTYSQELQIECLPEIDQFGKQQSYIYIYMPHV